MSFSFQPPVIAHRGARRDAPENTLPAFRKAKDLGFHWVEFDVRLTGCDEAIVFHDETLERTTNGKGRVQDCSYDYIKTLDAGTWFSSEFAGEIVPTLDEVLSCLELQGLAANIEIKGDEGKEEETVRKVLDCLHRHPVNTPILISSFSETILHCVRKYSPQMALGFLMDEWRADWQQSCNQLNAVAIHVNHAILNKLRVQEIKSSQHFLLTYTINDLALAKKIIGWGADAVFSDFPLFL